MEIHSKNEAQKRVDQIQSFTKELSLLEGESVLTLTPEQKSAIGSHHKGVINSLGVTYDVDIHEEQKRYSFGMKITSFIGALALSMGLYYLLYPFWGYMSTSTQVMILTLLPFGMLLLTYYLSSIESTGYFTKIAALTTLVAFILNLIMIGSIFNITPTSNSLLLFALFGMLLAYATDTRLLLGASILILSSYLSAQMGTWSGMYWISFGERPENFFLPALVLFLIPSFVSHERYSGFESIYRVFASIIFFLPVLILSNWGYASYMTWGANSIEMFYQVVGFVVSGVGIAVGITKNWGEVASSSNIFFTLFLYTKFYDWWWEAMPKFLFFMIIGLSSIAMLMFFKKIRTAISRSQM